MSNLTAKARQLRTVIENLSSNLNDEEAIVSSELFPQWQDNKVYKIGDRIRYLGTLYKVLQDHTSQNDWLPSTTTSLYAKVLIPNPDIIPVWEQPTAENAYMIGDKVYYPTAEDSIYESVIDNNVWSPTAYPAGWTLYISE